MSGERMNHADAAWQHMDHSTNLMMVNAVLWLDRPLERDAFLAILDKRMVGPFPRFRQHVVDQGTACGGPAWVDDPEFSLDRHVHSVRLEAPGDLRALQHFVSSASACRWTAPVPCGRPTRSTATKTVVPCSCGCTTASRTVSRSPGCCCR